MSSTDRQQPYLDLQALLHALPASAHQTQLYNIMMA